MSLLLTLHGPLPPQGDVAQILAEKIASGNREAAATRLQCAWRVVLAKRQLVFLRQRHLDYLRIFGTDLLSRDQRVELQKDLGATLTAVGRPSPAATNIIPQRTLPTINGMAPPPRGKAGRPCGSAPSTPHGDSVRGMPSSRLLEHAPGKAVHGGPSPLPQLVPPMR